MADDNRNRGYRANDPHHRPRPAAEQPLNDPLAELARLIGQQNESAPSYRQQGSRISHDDERDAQAHWAPPANPFVPRDSYPEHRQAPQPRSYHNPAATYGDGRYDLRRVSGAPQAESDYGHGAPQHSDPSYSDQSYPDQHYDDRRFDEPSEHSSYDSNTGYSADHGYSDPAGYSAYAGDSQPGYADPYFQRASYEQPSYGHDHYGHVPQLGLPSTEETAPARRRGGVVTALAVLALAVVGTAAAFGYRAMFATSGTPITPPVITADSRPSKVVPTADPNAKPIQDRIGVQTERVVPREEQPAAMRDPALAGSTRTIFQPPQAAANVAPPGAASVPAPADAKRVRTVTIKPEQGADAASARGPAQPRNAASSPPATVEDVLNTARAQAGSSSGNGPLALSPTTPPPTTSPQAQPQRQAARTNPAGSPFPAPVTSNGATGSTGAYAVQVTSQRSESDAQASFKSLQQQFPSVLGNRQPVIRRADLGDKGTYYRAQIPFGSQGEAAEFCSSLKAAGGQCVVQRN